MTKSKFLTAMLGGASVMALACGAQAQTAAPASKVEEVVVTGSRVIQNGNNSPTPVTVATTAQLQSTTPSTISDALYKLPVFATNSAQTRNPGNSGGNSGANTLDLRAIGAARTLVLFNGQRVPNGNVDQLPQMLMSRVDIVTGGASAVYGSDAVAGVVNFIIDKNFKGLRVNGQYGVSKYGDDKTWRLGVAGGKSFLDGKLHLEGSVEHYDDPGIFSKLSRKIGREVYSMQGITPQPVNGVTSAAGTAGNPYGLVINTRISNTSFGGKIISGPLNDLNFTTNGVLSPFVHGTRTGASTIESGGDGAYFYTASFKTLLKNTQVFGRADYDLTDTVHAWGSVSYVDGHNKNNHQTNEYRSYTLNGQNAFLAPQYRAQLAAAGAAGNTFVIGKMMQQAPPLQPETFLKTYMVNGGLDGKLDLFGSDWTWELAALTSKQTQHTYNNANMDNQKSIAALDAVTNPANGQIVCNASLSSDPVVKARYADCVPLNLFGPTSESQAALDYVLLKTDFQTFQKLDDVTASLAGSPFGTWAGPVQVALSGEMRKATAESQSKFGPTDKVDCLGLRYNGCSTTGAAGVGSGRWVSNVVANSPQAQSVIKEVAIESDVPLLKDVPLVQSFNINGAARYTKYDNQGSAGAASQFQANTWKVGVDWHLNDDLRVRATRSRDILAPSVSQLFGATSVNPAGITDLHTGVNSVAPVQTQSNKDLVPEVANTITAGFVYRPSFIRNFSIAVDYYDIKIDNGIGNVSGNNATTARICEDSNGTSPLCSLFVRPLPFSNRTPANYPTLILSQNLNIAEFHSHGVDTEVNYGFDAGPGRINLRGLYTYQPEQVTVSIPGTTPLDAAGNAGLPSSRVSLRGQYVQGPFTFDVNQRWHNATGRSSDPLAVYALDKVPAYYTTDITFTYNMQMLGGENQVFLNIQNLFNREPPPHGNVGGPSSVPGLFLATTNGDDIMGRYFTAGFRMKY